MGKLGVGEGGEGLGELGLVDVLAVDEEPLEERLVPLAAQVTGRLVVSALAVGQQVERFLERGLDLAEGLLGGLEVALGLVDLVGEPFLLLAEQSTGTAPA